MQSDSSHGSDSPHRRRTSDWDAGGPYNSVGHQVVVGELYESAFGILIAHTDKIQVAAVLSWSYAG